MKGSFNEMMDMNSKSAPPKKGEKAPELRSIEHSRSSNGGHVFEHRFASAGGPYKEPEMHTFGADEGKKALEHFAEHAGLSEHMGSADAEEEKGGGGTPAYA